MGCGCAGAQPKRTAKPVKTKDVEAAARRSGGPGQRGYYWEGPQGRPKTPSK